MWPTIPKITYCLAPKKMFADGWPTGKSKQRINQVIEVFRMASDISKEYTKKSSNSRNSSVNSKCEP